MKLLRSLLQRPKARQPKVVSTWTGWYAILNKYGHLSEIKPNRYAAQHALTMRGDGHECRIERVRVSLDGHDRAPDHLTAKPKRKSKR